MRSRNMGVKFSCMWLAYYMNYPFFPEFSENMLYWNDGDATRQDMIFYKSLLEQRIRSPGL
jgi:hypothetical protein